MNSEQRDATFYINGVKVPCTVTLLFNSGMVSSGGYSRETIDGVDWGDITLQAKGKTFAKPVTGRHLRLIEGGKD